MKLSLEVVKSPAALAKGLMGRTDLPSHHGMLFKFPMALEASFWGKDTHIPLDIAFIDSENKITSIRNIVPMSTRSVKSDNLCAMAIEANAGFFRRNGITEGMKVEFILDSKNDEIEAVFKS